MESMCAWYGMTRPSWWKSDHAMTSERRVRGAELASVLSHLHPFIEKAVDRARSFITKKRRRTESLYCTDGLFFSSCLIYRANSL